jgi:hypothetical protein
MSILPVRNRYELRRKLPSYRGIVPAGRNNYHSKDVIVIKRIDLKVIGGDIRYIIYKSCKEVGPTALFDNGRTG